MNLFQRWVPTKNCANFSEGCIDHNGNRVEPGGSYYDGCNWCRCGRNGRVSEKSAGEQRRNSVESALIR